jgi:hypothetical protein
MRHIRKMPEHSGTGPVPSPEQVQWLLDRDQAFHLVSCHADPTAICRSPMENREQHNSEHAGYGTVHHHWGPLLTWDENKFEAVLEECESGF